MIQLWEKLGNIYCPIGKNELFETHAYQPTPIVIGNKIRIYFASYNKNKIGRITFIDVDARNPKKIIYIHNLPILDTGEPGTFDCDGVSPSCIIKEYGIYYLFYFGWQRTERVPFMLYTGLAESTDGVVFKKYSRVPILDRTDNERFIRDASFVIRDNNKFTMYYVTSPKQWGEYCVNRLESWNIYIWNGNGKNAIPLKSDEFGIGRPCVIKEDGIYKMWYSYRGKNKPYKIGYAESNDGIVWERKDDIIKFVGIKDHWDSDMMCMPYVIDSFGERYMFYNGNKIGETGFGCARLFK